MLKKRATPSPVLSCVRPMAGRLVEDAGVLSYGGVVAVGIGDAMVSA